MNLISFIGKYIGPLRIVNVAEAERTTYLGNSVVKVELANKTKEEYPEEVLKKIATKEQKDLTSLRQIRTSLIAEKVLALLVESELPVYDPSGANIQYLLQSVLPEAIQENTRIAYGKLFSKNYYAITLLDLNKALKNNGKPKDKKEDDKAGSPS